MKVFVEGSCVRREEMTHHLGKEFDSAHKALDWAESKIKERLKDEMVIRWRRDDLVNPEVHKDGPSIWGAMMIEYDRKQLMKHLKTEGRVCLQQFFPPMGVGSLVHVTEREKAIADSEATAASLQKHLQSLADGLGEEVTGTNLAGQQFVAKPK